MVPNKEATKPLTTRGQERLATDLWPVPLGRAGSPLPAACDSTNGAHESRALPKHGPQGRIYRDWLDSLL
jgi:hypothetical protein